MDGGFGELEVAEEGQVLVERLGGRWTGAGGMCRCPAHADRRPSLSVRPGRKRLLLRCFAGCETKDILRALMAQGLLQPSVGAPAAGTDAARAFPSFSRAALRLWGSARPIADSPAEAYLRARGLTILSPELRYHPRAPHGPRPLTSFRPALIAAVRDERGLVAVHRTFLEHGGGARLAALTDAKCGLGPFGSGAVRLGGIAPRLGMAEGIETALAATMLFGMPCWAALGSERFARVALPRPVRELVLFLDNDQGGRRAETLAREAYAHLPIEARYPALVGADWNDMLGSPPFQPS